MTFTEPDLNFKSFTEPNSEDCDFAPVKLMLRRSDMERKYFFDP